MPLTESEFILLERENSFFIPWFQSVLVNNLIIGGTPFHIDGVGCLLVIRPRGLLERTEFSKVRDVTGIENVG